MEISGYQNYKDSGIDWLGDVPVHWKVKRLKNVTNYIQTGITPPSDKSEYYDGDIPWFGPGGFNGNTTLVTPSKYITEKAINDGEAKLFPIDSIFMVGIGATIGKVGLIKKPSSCNQQLNVINFQSFVKPDFGVLQMKLYEDVILSIANFSTLPIYNQVQTGNLKFLLPPMKEQLTIAEYLDEQTQKIDKLIANKKAQAEKLKELRQIEINNAVTKGLNRNAEMKDSGIDWLGEIPKHWEVKRLKNCTTIISKGTTPSTFGEDLEETGSIKFIKAENISNNRVTKDPEFFITEETDNILFRSKLQELDVLIVIAGATIGKTAILQKEFLPANTNQAVCFIRLNRKRMNEVFLNFWLHTTMIEQQILLDAVVSAQPNLSMTDLSFFPIVIPPIREQIQITNYLQQRTAGIDKLLNNINVQIVKLQELRKIKIYDAVTGKIKVNTYAEATA